MEEKDLKPTLNTVTESLKAYKGHSRIIFLITVIVWVTLTLSAGFGLFVAPTFILKHMIDLVMITSIAFYATTNTPV